MCDTLSRKQLRATTVWACIVSFVLASIISLHHFLAVPFISTARTRWLLPLGISMFLVALICRLQNKRKTYENWCHSKKSPKSHSRSNFHSGDLSANGTVWCLLCQEKVNVGESVPVLFIRSDKRTKLFWRGRLGRTFWKPGYLGNLNFKTAVNSQLGLHRVEIGPDLCVLCRRGLTDRI